MINRNYMLDLMKSKHVSIDEFNYESLTCPPLMSFFTQEDIWNLKNIATSIKYSAKVDLKFKEIDKIMRSRGFVKFVAGTNRICYRPVEYDNFVVKVAYDKVALQDNLSEYTNQFYLKPFCTKVFEVLGDGVIASFERVVPITNREEYLSVAEDVFTLLDEFIFGEYIMEDIGSRYYMNIGIRKSFGIVLLDFSFLYKLDGRKLFCTRPDPTTIDGTCGGEIDSDPGYNEFRCTKCGAKYRGRELAVEIKCNNNVILKEKGEYKMKVSIKGGTHNVNLNVSTEDFVSKKAIPSKPINSGFKLANNKNEEVKDVTVNGVPEVVDVKEVKEVEAIPEAVKVEEIKEEVKEVHSPFSIKEEVIVEEPKKIELPVEEEKKTNNEEVKKTECVKEKDVESKKKIDSSMSYVDLYKELKESCNNVDTCLGLILGNKSSNNKPQSKKLALELILKLFKKILPNISPEDMTKIVKELFTEYLRVDLIPSEQNDNYSVQANITDINDNIIYGGINNIGLLIVDNSSESEGENHESIIAIDESSDPIAYTEDAIRLIDEERFAAKVIDIKTIFADKAHRNVIVVEDINGDYLTVGENSDRLFTIDKLNDQTVDALSFISTEYFNNTLRTLDELEEQVNEYEKDNMSYPEDEDVESGKEVYDIPVGALPPVEEEEIVTVNGVPVIDEDDEIKDEG